MPNIKSQISNNNPVVSIVCITYNHEPYLRQALDGFLMQRTTFPVEIILAEDCSTDGTRAICEEYAKRYSKKIHYIVRDHNVGYNQNEYEAMQAARGKYIAFCEGDDYWTDADKLQRQVDFMEVHPDYSVCWHRCKHFNVETGEMREDQCAEILPDSAEGVDIDLNIYFAGWYTQPLTMVFRKEALDLSLYHRYRYFRDMHQMYHLLKQGKGYLFAFDGGVRTMHTGGVSSRISSKQYCDISLSMDREFYWKTLDKGPKKIYLETLDRCVQVYAKENKRKALRCAFIYMLVSHHPRSLVRYVKIIFRNE